MSLAFLGMCLFLILIFCLFVSDDFIDSVLIYDNICLDAKDLWLKVEAFFC